MTRSPEQAPPAASGLEMPSTQIWASAIYGTARARGITVWLTGQVGNMSVSYTGFELLPELLRAVRVIKLWREGAGLGRNRSMTWRSFLGLLANWPTSGWERAEVMQSYRHALLRGIAAGHFIRRATEGSR